MLRLSIVVFIALAGLRATSAAEEKFADVHVLGDRTFAPFESCGGFSSQAIGILVNQWRLMGERANIHVNYTCDDWAKAQELVANGGADAIGGMVKSPSREAKFRFIRQLVPNPPEYFYYDTLKWPPDQPAPNFASLVQASIQIGVVEGDYAQERLAHDYPSIRLRTYPSYKDVIAAALAKQIDVFVMEESVASHWLDRLGVTNRFTRSASYLFWEWLWAAVRKDNTQLATKLEQAFSHVSDAELAQVAQTWVDPLSYDEIVLQTLESLRESFPTTLAIGAVLAFYLAANGVLYLFFPPAVFHTSAYLRSLDITLKCGPIEKITLRMVVPATLADTSRQVLDALIEDRRTLIFENFSNRKIVREREVYFAPQFIISGELIEIGGIDERRRQLLARLRSVFARPYASVLITSEGGGGKTSLACWIGRNGLQARTPATIAARQRLVSISSRRGPSGFEVEGLSRAATRQTLARGHRGCPQPTYSDRSGNGFCQ